MMTNKSYAIVFPGQGSQSVGMLAELADAYPSIKQIFVEASDALGYDLWHLVQNGPADELDKTAHTQPALLTASYALWQVLQASKDIKPAFLAGHSLGEYTALVCAKAISFTDAVKLVAARGQFMQEAVLPGVGAMAALIGLEEDVVRDVCKQAVESQQEVLAPANFNSIGQVVVSGHKASVERAIVLAKERGAKLAVMIPVSVPSHCELMRPAAERLAERLAAISVQAPLIPVVNNVDAVCYTDAQSIVSGLVRQLYMPVRWVETIQFFAKAGFAQIIECGPGKVLTGLNKRIDKQLVCMTTTDAASLAAILAAG